MRCRSVEEVIYSQCTEVDNFCFQLLVLQFALLQFLPFKNSSIITPTSLFWTSQRFCNFITHIIYRLFYKWKQWKYFFSAWVYCSSCPSLMEANWYFNFHERKNVLCLKFESQNWQYELINCQSHNVHLRYGISLCMAFYVRIHCIVLMLHSYHMTILNHAGQYC